MNKTAVIWTIVALVVIGGIVWWIVSSPTQMQPAAAGANPMIPATTTAATTSSNTTGTTAPMSATVTFDGSTFSPQSVTIAEGGTVTFTDTSNQPFWVASDPHPIHNGYDGTTLQQHCAPGYTGPAPFDECSPGITWSFTFDKVGSWGYHDHLDATVMGVVNVVAQ